MSMTGWSEGKLFRGRGPQLNRVLKAYFCVLSSLSHTSGLVLFPGLLLCWCLKKFPRSSQPLWWEAVPRLRTQHHLWLQSLRGQQWGEQSPEASRGAVLILEWHPYFK